MGLLAKLGRGVCRNAIACFYKRINESDIKIYHFRNGPRATIPKKEQAFWETALPGSPKCLAWLLAHTVQDAQGLVYAKTQDFALTPAGYFDIYASRNGSRDRVWDFEKKLGSSSLHTAANLQKIKQDIFMGSDFASSLASVLPKPKGP